MWRPLELSDTWWLVDGPRSTLPSDRKLLAGAQLLTSSGLLLRHHPAIPVWVELHPFWGHQLLNSWQEKSALWGQLLISRGRNSSPPGSRMPQGPALPVVGWGGFSFVFSVLFFFFLIPSRDQNLWKLGKLGGETPFSFCLGGQLFNPEVKQVFLAPSLCSFPWTPGDIFVPCWVQLPSPWDCAPLQPVCPGFTHPAHPAAWAALLCTTTEELIWRHILWFPAVLLCNQSTGKYSLYVVINSYSRYGRLLCNNYVEITTEDCCGCFFFFCWSYLFIYFCAWHALQWEEQALVSALTKTGPQAGVGIQHGPRHCLTGCWLLYGSLCVATQALQGKSGPVLFRHLFILALLCEQTCCPSLQVWCCTCVYSEINPSCLFGGVGGTLPCTVVSLAASSPALWAGSSGSCCLAKAVLRPRPKCSSPAPQHSSLQMGSSFLITFPPAVPPSVWMWN